MIIMMMMLIIVMTYHIDNDILYYVHQHIIHSLNMIHLYIIVGSEVLYVGGAKAVECRNRHQA